ncbi:MAG TPA: hypothetical protein VF468_19205, partial [Actinomycetota bacterium]|nr:hypothetical protein [Actinomycetota bacterium]
RLTSPWNTAAHVRRRGGLLVVLAVVLDGDPALGSKDRWLRDIPATLRTDLPKLEAVVLFDRLATPSPATRGPGWSTARPGPEPGSPPPGRIPT